MDTADVRRRAETIFDRRKPGVPGIEPDLEETTALMRQFETEGWLNDIPWQAEKAPRRGGKLRYQFDNDQFRHADSIFLALMLRHIRPRRVIEVGSGWSTCAMLDARDRWPGAVGSVTAIDPDPSRLTDQLSSEDLASIELHASRVQDLPLSVFDPLQDGDLLFIDSSHVLKTGSDVNHLIFEVLPRLPCGTWVHVHDVVWPFEYPQAWVEEGRSWNEAYAWRAFLQFNETFRIVLWPSQLMALHEPWFHEKLPLTLQDPGGSLWLRRCR